MSTKATREQCNNKGDCLVPEGGRDGSKCLADGCKLEKALKQSLGPGCELAQPQSFDYYMYSKLVITGVCVCVCGSQRTTCRSWFSPLSMWVLGIKLGLSGLVAGAFVLFTN